MPIIPIKWIIGRAHKLVVTLELLVGNGLCLRRQLCQEWVDNFATPDLLWLAVVRIALDWLNIERELT